MSRREQLQEQYEDALFALMMDDVATAEGKKYLEENERLKNDPEAAVPEEISRECLRTIRREFAKRKARTAGRVTAKVFGRVAMAAGVAAMLFTAAFATSETVRISTMNLVVQVFGESTDFSFRDTQATTPILRLTAGWLPEGYILESHEESSMNSWYLFRRSQTESIKINYILGDGTVLSVDTENAETENIQINGAQALLIKKNGEQQIVWGTEGNTAFITIISTRASREDLIHVANFLEY